ncbi:MAG: ferredoxin [Collimonas sp.]
MCTGPLCTKDGVQSQAMFERLGQKIDARSQLKVKRTRTHCMVACKMKGPILVVYPEGIWYRCADERALERIVTEHLEGGCEVTEYVIHRLGEGDVCQPVNEDV